MQYMVGYDVEGTANSKAYMDRVRTYLSTMSFNDGTKDTAAAMDLGNFDYPDTSEEEPPVEELQRFKASVGTVMDTVTRLINVQARAVERLAARRAAMVRKARLHHHHLGLKEAVKI